MLQQIKRIMSLYEEALSMTHRQEIARELREQDDIFLLLLYSEVLGIPNPVFYFTFELYPYMIDDFHDWHLRMGMDKSPITGVRCC